MQFWKSWKSGQLYKLAVWRQQLFLYNLNTGFCFICHILSKVWTGTTIDKIKSDSPIFSINFEHFSLPLQSIILHPSPIPTTSPTENLAETTVVTNLTFHTSSHSYEQDNLQKCYESHEDKAINKFEFPLTGSIVDHELLEYQSTVASIDMNPQQCITKGNDKFHILLESQRLFNNIRCKLNLLLVMSLYFSFCIDWFIDLCIDWFIDWLIDTFSYIHSFIHYIEICFFLQTHSHQSIRLSMLRQRMETFGNFTIYFNNLNHPSNASSIKP